MFYLMTDSTHFISGYMALDIMVKVYGDSQRGNPLPPLLGLLFVISSNGFCIYTIHIQDSTFQSLCFTSCGVLTETAMEDPSQHERSYLSLPRISNNIFGGGPGS